MTSGPATYFAIERCKKDARILAAQAVPEIIDCAGRLCEQVPELGLDGALEVIDAIAKWMLEKETKK